jgi:hypothetical protein
MREIDGMSVQSSNFSRKDLIPGKSVSPPPESISLTTRAQCVGYTQQSPRSKISHHVQVLSSKFVFLRLVAQDLQVLYP